MPGSIAFAVQCSPDRLFVVAREATGYIGGMITKAHRIVLAVKSREAGGQGFANATITFQLKDGGGDLHTSAQISGKAASMGEGVVYGVLDALIADFAGKLGAL